MASMLPLRLLLPRQGRVLRLPRHILTSEQRQVVLLNCRFRSARRPQYGKRIKDGRLNRRLRSSANRPPLGSGTPLFRIRSLSLLTRERSGLAYGGTTPNCPPSQPTIQLVCLPLLTNRSVRRQRPGSLKKLRHYRRTELGVAHRLLLIFISMRTT